MKIRAFYFQILFFLVLLPLISVCDIAPAPSMITHEIETSKVAPSFGEGISRFTNKDYQGAKTAFLASLDSKNPTSAILVNLALCEFNLNSKGRAMGLLRQVLRSDPSNAAANDALRYVQTKLTTQDIAHEETYYESFRRLALNLFSLQVLFFIHFISFSAFGFILLRYYSRRRKALQQELETPSLKPIEIFFGALLLGFSLLLAGKIYDNSMTRVTVISDKVEVRSGPVTDAPELFTLFEGLEVVVLEAGKEWSHISYPGGSSGWVPTQTLGLDLFDNTLPKK